MFIDVNPQLSTLNQCTPNTKLLLTRYFYESPPPLPKFPHKAEGERSWYPICLSGDVITDVMWCDVIQDDMTIGRVDRDGDREGRILILKDSFIYSTEKPSHHIASDPSESFQIPIVISIQHWSKAGTCASACAFFAR